MGDKRVVFFFFLFGYSKAAGKREKRNEEEEKERSKVECRLGRAQQEGKAMVVWRGANHNACSYGKANPICWHRRGARADMREETNDSKLPEGPGAYQVLSRDR